MSALPAGPAAVRPASEGAGRGARPAVPPTPRCFVVWFPDWPVTAWRRGAMNDADAGAVAVIAAGRVLACSGPARGEGVRRGQRRREAQAACPSLVAVPADPVRDQRVFDPVIARLEELAPGVQQIRPGLVALKARGPARYYGGEASTAEVFLDCLAAQGTGGARVGVADGVFTAEQAAYATSPDAPVLVVPAGASAAFLAPLPVETLGDDELSRLLPQLGVRRLGDFAALAVGDVRERLGERGVRLHALATGRDTRPVVPRVPPAQLAAQIDFEPPLSRTDQVAFSVRRTAGSFISGLAGEHLVCTELGVTVTTDRGEAVGRVWLHPFAFDAAAVVDRVRWQLEAAAGSAITGPVSSVRLEPVTVEAAFHHEPGLFGSASDERVHDTVSRVQSMLGHEGVLTATIGGGRWLAERAVLVPWGDRPVAAQPVDRPWPGHLPAPLPAVVFPVPRPVSVLAVGEAPVTVDERGTLSAPPLVLVDDYDRRRITAWAGPWPIDERTWDPGRHRRACRFQAVDAAQGAWLLVLDEGGDWWAEGRYD